MKHKQSYKIKPSRQNSKTTQRIIAATKLLAIALLVSRSSVLANKCDPDRCITCKDAKCTECDNSKDWFINTDYCTWCTGVVTSCEECQEAGKKTTCKKCRSGYFKESNTKCSRCSDIYPNCKTCDDSSGAAICIACNEKYKLSGSGECICDTSKGWWPRKADDGCNSCGYLQNGCKECQVKNGETTCKTCGADKGFTKVKVTNNKGKVVPEDRCTCDNEKLWYTTQDKESCGRCSDVVENCVNCTEKDLVTKCKDCNHPAGFFITKQFTCAICSVASEGCLRCEEANSKTNCPECNIQAGFLADDNFDCKCKTDKGFNLKSGSKPDLTDSKCVCNNAVGLFFKNSDACDTCSNLRPGCSACTDQLGYTTCTTCLTAAGFVTDNNWGCKCDNSKGLYFKSASLCDTCTNLKVGCLKCNDLSGPTVCEKCDLSKGYILDSSGNCKCNNQAGLYFKTDNTCNTCPNVLKGCIVCDDTAGTSVCKACNLALGYTLSVFNTCKCDNSKGLYFMPDKSCGECAKAISGCTSCDDSSGTTTCSSCDASKGYMPDGSGGCKCNNSAGYYPSADKTCRRCSDVIFGCNVCDDSSGATVCSTCDPSSGLIKKSGICGCDNSAGKFLKPDRTCDTCSNIKPGCTACTDSSLKTECLTCDRSAGYVVDFETKGCRRCSEVLDGCSVCTEVEPPHRTCEVCDKSDPQNLKYLTPSKFCSACNVVKPNCQTCDDSSGTTVCNACKPNFLMRTSDNSCRACSEFFPNCGECNAMMGTKLCTSCKTGFEFDSTGIKCVACSTFVDNCSECSKDSASGQVKCSKCGNLMVLKDPAAGQNCISPIPECTKLYKDETTGKTLCSACRSPHKVSKSGQDCLHPDNDIMTQNIIEDQVGLFLRIRMNKEIEIITKTQQNSRLKSEESTLPGFQTTANQPAATTTEGIRVDPTKQTDQVIPFKSLQILNNKDGSQYMTTDLSGFELKSKQNSSLVFKDLPLMLNHTNYMDTSYNSHFETLGMVLVVASSVAILLVGLLSSRFMACTFISAVQLIKYSPLLYTKYPTNYAVFSNQFKKDLFWWMGKMNLFKVGFKGETSDKAMESCKIHLKLLAQDLTCKNITELGGIYTVLIILTAVKLVLIAARKTAKLTNKDKLSNTMGFRKLILFLDRSLISGGFILLILIGAQIPLLIPSFINISALSFDTASDKINFLLSVVTIFFYFVAFMHSNYEVISAFGGKQKYSKEMIVSMFVWGEFLTELHDTSAIDSFLLGMLVLTNFLVALGLTIAVKLTWLSLMILMGGYGLIATVTYMSDYIEPAYDEKNKKDSKKKNKKERKTVRKKNYNTAKDPQSWKDGDLPSTSEPNKIDKTNPKEQKDFRFTGGSLVFIALGLLVLIIGVMVFIGNISTPSVNYYSYGLLLIVLSCVVVVTNLALSFKHFFTKNSFRGACSSQNTKKSPVTPAGLQSNLDRISG